MAAPQSLASLFAHTRAGPSHATFTPRPASLADGLRLKTNLHAARIFEAVGALERVLRSAPAYPWVARVWAEIVQPVRFPRETLELAAYGAACDALAAETPSGDPILDAARVALETLRDVVASPDRTAPAPTPPAAVMFGRNLDTERMLLSNRLPHARNTETVVRAPPGPVFPSRIAPTALTGYANSMLGRGVRGRLDL